MPTSLIIPRISTRFQSQSREKQVPRREPPLIEWNQPTTGASPGIRDVTMRSASQESLKETSPYMSRGSKDREDQVGHSTCNSLVNPTSSWQNITTNQRASATDKALALLKLEQEFQKQRQAIVEQFETPPKAMQPMSIQIG